MIIPQSVPVSPSQSQSVLSVLSCRDTFNTNTTEKSPQVTAPVTTGLAAVSVPRASPDPSVASPAPPGPTAGGAWASAPVRTGGSVTTCPGPAGAQEAGQERTVPSPVLLAGSVPAVSTTASVTTEPPVTRWTGSASASRASRGTGELSVRSCPLCCLSLSNLFAAHQQLPSDMFLLSALASQ